MKRILYFDMWSVEGHLVFNDVHLKALCQLGDVYTIFREGYHTFDYQNVYNYLDVPNSFYVKGESYYKTRIRLAGMIKWVWDKVSKEKWDYVIFSSYDPFSLFLSRRFRNAIVIDHNTIALLDSKLHGFPFRHLSTHIKHIVFNAYMQSRLNEMGFNNVAIVPHGFLPKKSEPLSVEDVRKVRQKYSLGTEDKIIFLPSLSKSNVDLIGRYIYNDNFNKYLKEYGLKLITKSLVKRASMSNIIIIDDYLSQEDYNYLFLHSSCNVLFYSQDFKYRASGVLNECFANNIPCVISDNPSLKAYLPYINNSNCVFRDADELISSILSALQMDRKKYYNNLGEIQDPLNAWESVLRE